MRNDVISKIGIGLLGGFAGTVAMSATMAVIQRMLPPRRRERYEPRQVVEGILEQTNLDCMIDDEETTSLVATSHLAYGAGMGAAYEVLIRPLPLPKGVRGAAWGLAVWTASYCGWLPALGIMAPAHRRPLARNALMIAAHLVWGATTEILADSLNRDQRRQARHPQSERSRSASVPNEREMTREPDMTYI